MEERLKIGILGGGGILGAHAPGFREMRESAIVTAVAEPNENQHGRLRNLLGPDIEIYPNYGELLANANADAVDIILPHDLHVSATEMAARAGKHILVEKVMGRDIRECDQMIEACDEAGVSLTVCHDRRHHAHWMALKDIIDSGVIGTPFHWKLEHNQDVSVPPGNWIHSRERLGGGAIMSCLTHQIDALRWYAGEPTSVTCMTQTLPRRMEGETVGTILAKMPNGALAQLTINWFTRSNRPSGNALWYELVHVCGDQGEAYLMSGRGVFLRQHNRTESRWSRTHGDAIFDEFLRIETGDWCGHVRCIREWIRSLRGESAEITTGGRQCRGTVEVAQAAYLSERTGRVVNLPLNENKQ